MYCRVSTRSHPSGKWVSESQFGAINQCKLSINNICRSIELFLARDVYRSKAYDEKGFQKCNNKQICRWQNSFSWTWGQIHLLLDTFKLALINYPWAFDIAFSRQFVFDLGCTTAKCIFKRYLVLTSNKPHVKLSYLSQMHIFFDSKSL